MREYGREGIVGGKGGMIGGFVDVDFLPKF